jgi:hypothetical protein
MRGRGRCRRTCRLFRTILKNERKKRFDRLSVRHGYPMTRQKPGLRRPLSALEIVIGTVALAGALYIDDTFGVVYDESETSSS